MGIKATIVALALLLPSAAAAQSLQPTKEEIQEAIEASGPYGAYREADLAAFRKDLQAALGKAKLDAAADQVGAKYGFQSADIRKFVRAWVMAQAHQYGSDDDLWKPPVRKALYEAAPNLRGTRLGLSLLAETLDQVSDCSADDFQALMAGSIDSAADAYVIANNATCNDNFTRAVVAAGNRAMPALIRQANYGGLPLRDRLPLYAWLTSPAALSRVREAERPAVAAMLWQEYLVQLFQAGLERQALSAFDALPDDLRKAVVSPNQRPAITTTIDGVAMTFAGEGEEGHRDLSQIDAPIRQLADVLAVVGRADEARRLLATLPGLADARAAVLCEYNHPETENPGCANTRMLPAGALPLDHLLNRPEEDPYPIAETTLTGMGAVGGSVSAEVLCRVFPKETYVDLCRERDPADFWSDGDEEGLPLAEAAIERAVPNFKALRSSIVGDRRAVAPPQGRRTRATVAAIPPPFAEAPIPVEFRGEGKAPSVRGLKALPRGFNPVRVERTGKRVIAISVSQTYDPSGEVSQGGYWVHVSEDGGKHWQAPLYTGLADRFPYVVKPLSRLSLIDGDTLRLAVDIAEIDTASIMYPPVALVTRREAQDLYLTIPLDVLRRDSDGDGLTDITEHHLLLDGANGRATPFIVGSDVDSDCRTPLSDEKRAFIDLLGRFNGRAEAALVEPVNRPPGQIALGWSQASAAVDQPVFLQGDRRDYTCLTSKRLIIVYSEADLEAMKPLSPDFHALEVPRIIFNRAHDRGYVNWSAGWTGGTFGLRRVDGKWRFYEISSWIT
jgi:hypothetical protein